MTLERTTVHINDDTGRVAMYDKRTSGTDSFASSTVRYVYSNHLSTASLELDGSAAIISYEEYHPYGTSSYKAMNATVNAVAKRYKYTGKERDEETGLYYIGARYYCPWLTRWCADDPINSEWYNLIKGVPQRNSERDVSEIMASGYEYCYDNPVRFIDPTGEQAPKTETPQPTTGYREKHNEKGYTGEPITEPIPLEGVTVSASAKSSNGIGYTSMSSHIPLTQLEGHHIGTGTLNNSGNSTGWAYLALTAIKIDLATPEPTDAVPVKWAGEAILGTVSLIAIGVGAINAANEEPFSPPLAVPLAPAVPITDKKPKNEKYLYRFDERNPAQIISQGGFKAWGTNMDLFLHAYGSTTFEQTSAYISTSKSLDALKESLPTGKSGYIYQLKWQPHGIDVNQVLGWKSPHPKEQEIAVPYFISALSIMNITQFTKR